MNKEHQQKKRPLGRLQFALKRFQSSFTSSHSLWLQARLLLLFTVMLIIRNNHKNNNNNINKGAH